MELWIAAGIGGGIAVIGLWLIIEEMAYRSALAHYGQDVIPSGTARFAAKIGRGLLLPIRKMRRAS